MTNISYAQNHEDIVLVRALSGVDKGFYIDIGAYDPKLDSVTKLFYDAGWSGINVEPQQKMFVKLQEQRKRDTNLNIAISDQVGQATFYELVVTETGGSGMSTLSPEVVETLTQQHDTIQRIKHTVNTTTLDDICEKYAPEEIHFLKLDIEGFEEQALKGLDLQKYRPWIVLVEATYPMSSRCVHKAWEHFLLSQDYEFTLFDGVNRFYLAKEHPELRDKLSYPVCCFDQFSNERHLTWPRIAGDVLTMLGCRNRKSSVRRALKKVYHTFARS